MIICHISNQKAAEKVLTRRSILREGMGCLLKVQELHHSAEPEAAATFIADARAAAEKLAVHEGIASSSEEGGGNDQDGNDEIIASQIVEVSYSHSFTVNCQYSCGDQLECPTAIHLSYLVWLSFRHRLASTTTWTRC